MAALEALRKLEAQAEHRLGGSNWDWELDGSSREDIPVDVGIMTVKETVALLKVSQDAIYELGKT